MVISIIYSPLTLAGIKLKSRYTTLDSGNSLEIEEYMRSYMRKCISTLDDGGDIVV